MTKQHTTMCNKCCMMFYEMLYSFGRGFIRHAKRKQKTLAVTLLYLKNAFGEVSHSLIPTVLQFHHIPREMQNIISELYSGFPTSIATKTFVTSTLQVEKGVHQGHCLKADFLSWQRSLAYSLRIFKDNFSFLLPLQRVLAAWFKIFN